MTDSSLPSDNSDRPDPPEAPESIPSGADGSRGGDAGVTSGGVTSGGGRNPMETASRAIRPLGVGEARRLATVAARVALENRARDVVVLDVTGQSAEFDFFVIATGTSRRQLHAVSEEIDDALEKGLGERRLGIEGYQESNWIVLDYGSLVVHLFDAETREFYDLESLWADGQMVPLADLGLNADGSPTDGPGDESGGPS